MNRHLLWTILLCGVSEASVLYVELPDSVSIEDFWNADSVLHQELLELARSTISQAYNPGGYGYSEEGEGDAVVIFVKNGQQFPRTC